MEGREPDEFSHREIETKILNIGSPDAFKARILAGGGELVRDRRLLNDTSHALPKDGNPENTIRLSTNGFGNVDELREILALLGVEIIEEQETGFVLHVPQGLPRRTVRIRDDGGHSVLTVKEKRNRKADIEDRVEIETAIPKIDKAVELLEKVGYQPQSIREKYRTTYRIGEVLVELNEGPAGAPWAEVEGPSMAAVEETVRALGYSAGDIANISDSEHYRNQGVPEEQIRHLTFGGGRERSA